MLSKMRARIVVRFLQGGDMRLGEMVCFLLLQDACRRNGMLIAGGILYCGVGMLLDSARLMPR